MHFAFCIIFPQKKSINPINPLINHLEASESTLPALRATAGFDGFVDQIVKIVRYKEEGAAPSFFNSKKEFADYIHEKEGTSFSLELQEQVTKLGGNMPIMANALATLGIQINCIGALGYPQQHSVFNTLSTNCKLFSFAEPGYSTAYEFQDGKMMMGHFGQLHTTGWEAVKNRIGLKTIIDLYRNSELICFVNWSEIDASTSIWKGILEEVLPAVNHDPIAFFDLSDCTKRSDQSVSEALHLIGLISRHAKVILGLNRNESRHICRLLNCQFANDDLLHAGEAIFKKLQPTILVLHTAREAVAIDNTGCYRHHSFFIKNPTISTGAGDNFNAGFCAAQLLKCNPHTSVIFANAVAGLYVINGKSPTVEELIRFLREIKS